MIKQTIVHPFCCCCSVQSLSHVQLFCNPMNYSPPGSSIHGISQGRIQEWFGISFSRAVLSPGIEPMYPALEGRFLSTEPPVRPCSTSIPWYIYSWLLNNLGIRGTDSPHSQKIQIYLMVSPTHTRMPYKDLLYPGSSLSKDLHLQIQPITDFVLCV